jgi:hypothetical protein
VGAGLLLLLAIHKDQLTEIFWRQQPALPRNSADSTTRFIARRTVRRLLDRIRGRLHLLDSELQ